MSARPIADGLVWVPGALILPRKGMRLLGSRRTMARRGPSTFSSWHRWNLRSVSMEHVQAAQPPAAIPCPPAYVLSGTSACAAGCFSISPRLSPGRRRTQCRRCHARETGIRIRRLACPGPDVAPFRKAEVQCITRSFVGCRQHGQDRSAVRVFVPSPGVWSTAPAPSKTWQLVAARDVLLISSPLLVC